MFEKYPEGSWEEWFTFVQINKEFVDAKLPVTCKYIEINLVRCNILIFSQLDMWQQLNLPAGKTHMKNKVCNNESLSVNKLRVG